MKITKSNQYFGGNKKISDAFLSACLHCLAEGEFNLAFVRQRTNQLLCFVSCI